jgi:hypothetical protein
LLLYPLSPNRNNGDREMNIGGRKEQEADDVSKLSDTELIRQLADQAKELGVKIDLSYDFGQQQKPDDEAGG